MTVRAMEPWQVEAEPAGIATTSFLVHNSSSNSIEILEEVDLPQGWELVTGESCLELGPGEERLRLVSFHVPRPTPAGPYTVSYKVNGLGGYSCLGWSEVTVAVLPAAGLSIIASEVPRRIIAGETFRARLTIVNDGNLASRVLVRVTSSESYPVRPDTVGLNVGVGRRHEVAVEVETPRDVERKVLHTLVVEALAFAPLNGEVAARSTTAQEIIPRGAQAYDPYHRVPCTLRTAYVGGAGWAGIQMEYSGKGRLAEEGDAEADFLIRGPDARESSVFGLRDEYRLRLAGANYSVQLGDAVYDLSPLTAWHRYGRGLAAGFDLGSWTLGGSHIRTLWGGPRMNEGTAHVRYRHGEALELGLNYLEKREASRHGVLSISAAAKPLRPVGLELEYALAPGGRDHQAYRTRLQGAPGDVRYFFERIRAGKSYIGQHANEIQTTGSLSFPASWGLRLRGFYREYHRMCNGDVDAASRTSEHVSSLGLKRALPLGMRAAIEYWDVRRDGGTAANAFEYETTTVKIGIERPHPTVSAGGSLEFGRLCNRLERRKHDVGRHGLRVSYKPNSWCRISGHFQSALSGSGDPTMRSDVAGVRLELTPSDNLELDAGLQWRDYSGDAGAGVDEFTAGAAHTLPSGHRVSGKLRRTRYDANGRDQTVFHVAYEVPTGMRGSRRKSTGSLCGTVCDEEDPLHSGLGDVVVLLDDLAVVTDEDGEFSFPSLAPGEYHLMIDQESVGLNRVSTRRLPLRIEVSGGREAKVDLGVTTSGCVEGEVTVDGSSDACVGDRGGAGGDGPPHLLVELSSQLETLQCVTDSRGKFVFRGVRPGQWLLTVHSEGLSPRSELAQDTYPVEVLSGATSRVVAKIVPLRREIPIVDEGEVRVLGRTP